jgi:predicted nuclease of predicted toxin-antitoxin system
MRFPADESCDFGVVRTLRTANNDVIAISEISPRAYDLDVMEFAIAEGRILLTEDKDSGQLVYAQCSIRTTVFSNSYLIYRKVKIILLMCFSIIILLSRITTVQAYRVLCGKDRARGIRDKCIRG